MCVTFFLQDFEKYGVFDAQTQLEKVHKEEEDALYQEIFEDRKEQVRLCSHASCSNQRQNCFQWNALTSSYIVLVHVSILKLWCAIKAEYY